jgi:hypothetical protein
MRDLKRNDRNRLEIGDLMDSEHPVVFFYRNPTTEEIVRYSRECYDIKGDTMTPIVSKKIDLVLAVLTGIGDDCFGFDGQPLSSEEGKPGYRADWKELLRDVGARYLMPAAVTIFENVSVKTGPFASS